MLQFHVAARSNISGVYCEHNKLLTLGERYTGCKCQWRSPNTQTQDSLCVSSGCNLILELARKIQSREMTTMSAPTVPGLAVPGGGTGGLACAHNLGTGLLPYAVQNT